METTRFFSKLFKRKKLRVSRNLFVDLMSPVSIFPGSYAALIMSLVNGEWFDAFKRYLVYHSIIIVLLLSPFNNSNALELSDLSVEFTKYSSGDRHYALPNSEHLDGAVNIEFTLSNNYIYITPGIDSFYTDQQFRFIESRVEAGIQYFDDFDFFVRHKSAHGLDNPLPNMEKYPKTDEIGVRFKFK